MSLVADAAILAAAEALAQAGQVDEVGLQGQGQLVKVALLGIVTPARFRKVVVGNGIGKHHVLVPVDPAVAVEVGIVQRGVAFLVDFQYARHGDGRFHGGAQNYAAGTLLLLLLGLSLSLSVLLLVVSSGCGCGSSCSSRRRQGGEQQQEEHCDRRRCCLPRSRAHFWSCRGKRYRKHCLSQPPQSNKYRSRQVNHPCRVVVLWRSVPTAAPINHQHQQSQASQDLFATIQPPVRRRRQLAFCGRGIRARWLLPRPVEGRTKGCCATNQCRIGGSKVIGRRSHRRPCSAMAVPMHSPACQSLQARKQASVARARQTSQISEKIGRRSTRLRNDVATENKMKYMLRRRRLYFW